MHSLLIDGSRAHDSYRCSCDCGAAWSGGQGERGSEFDSPALPIAEAVIHFKRVHPTERANIEFSARFRLALIAYWDLAHAAVMDDNALLHVGHLQAFR